MNSECPHIHVSQLEPGKLTTYCPACGGMVVPRGGNTKTRRSAPSRHGQSAQERLEHGQKLVETGKTIGAFGGTLLSLVFWLPLGIIGLVIIIAVFMAMLHS